jgi:putative spermidine/putrescine transport system permease protein
LQKRDFTKTGLGVYTAVIVFFVYAPIFTMVVFSFNTSNRTAPPFDGPNTQWYSQVFNNSDIVGALSRSIELALVTMIVSTLLFTLAGLAYRRRFKGDEFLFYLITIGIIMPGITYSLGMALFYKYLGVGISLWTALPVHLIWTLPWGLILIRANIDPNILLYEEAAKTLGANEWKIVRKITLPLFFPAMIGGALFAFTLSFTELVRSIFVASPNTLPLEIFDISQIEVTPAIFALGSLIVLVSLGLLVVASVFLRGAFERLRV